MLKDLRLHSQTKVHRNSLLDGVRQVAHRNVHFPPDLAINRYHTFLRGSFQVAFMFLPGMPPSRRLIQEHVFLPGARKRLHMGRCVISKHLDHIVHRTH